MGLVFFVFASALSQISFFGFFKFAKISQKPSWQVNIHAKSIFHLFSNFKHWMVVIATMLYVILLSEINNLSVTDYFQQIPETLL